MGNTFNTPRLTQIQKDASGKEYYKHMMDSLDKRVGQMQDNFVGVSDYKRMKVNYDLFNNIIDLEDFTYVIQPYGAKVGELPAQLTNRDILSPKLKVLIGMEMQRPFEYKVMAVNEEATTRKEQAEAEMIKDFVVSQIMSPIRTQIEQQYAAQSKGRQLTEDENQQIAQQIQQEIAAKTPPEVRKYMTREHQDPSESQGQQILSYLQRKNDFNLRFSDGWKNAVITGKEIYWNGIEREHPEMRVVNPLYFNHDRSPDNYFIEDGEWATYKMRWTSSEVIAKFGNELTNEQIDNIYRLNEYGIPVIIANSTFEFTDGFEEQYNLIPVKHYEWKGLAKIGFLTYLSPDTGQIEEDIVDESYRLNREAGDIEIKWEWIPEKHEGYRIGHDIYVKMQPVVGQFKDLDNLYTCKLSYQGVLYDSVNSQSTSPADRGKPWQYYYNIIWFRIETLMAQDKGKKIVVNYNAIAKSLGITLDKFFYYMDAMQTILVNPAEEGNRGGSHEVSNLVTTADMSLISDIFKYIQLADKCEERCGLGIGITRPMEGNIAQGDAVTNTKQSIVQGSYILEPYFALHNVVKKNVLQSQIDIAKVCYTNSNLKVLSYVLDDMSLQMLKIDQELLDNSTLGIFVDSSTNSAKIKEMIEQLAHAAVQNDKIELSDLIKTLKADGVLEAEEILEEAEDKKQQQLQQQATQEQDAQAQEAEKARQFTRETWAHEADMIKLKEGERRETEIEKQAVLSLGFATDKDVNNNNVPDVLEVAKQELDANIKNKKVNLELDKFAHQQKIDNEKIAIEKKKLNKPTK